MTGLRLAPLKSVCVFSIFLTTTALSGCTQTFAASPDAVIDGIPSLAACEKLGFDLGTESDDGVAPSGGSKTRKLGIARYVAPQAPMESFAKPAPLPAPAPAIAVEPGQAAAGMADRPVVDTERYPHATENPIKRVADAPVSTFSIDVDTAAYANVRRFLNNGSLPPHDAVRVEELVNYFDYGYARPSVADVPFAATVSRLGAQDSGGELLVSCLRNF